MGKKGFNWRARLVKETIIDNSETKNISIDLATDTNKQEHYDPSNELVLPSKKRKTKVKEKNEKIVKILSRKQRKKLEKVVENKKKKSQRSKLLEELKKVQIEDEERKQLKSLSSVQTKGLKRMRMEKFEKKREKIVHENTVSEDEEEEIEVKRVKMDDDADSENVEIIENEPVKIEDDSEIPEKNIENINEKLVIIDLVETEDKTVDCDKKEEKPKHIVPKTECKMPQKEFIPVLRSSEIQKQRMKLPILSLEHEIMELITQNSIVVLSGETGSGKTTQLPQFLYEAGYCQSSRICITEPRRLAAISMAKRVKDEMGLNDTKEVGYLVRFEGDFEEGKTKILFMTDGVLLREIKTDFLLTKYSAIIVDEAHERSMNTDILIGFLSRIVKLRLKKGLAPLKLIIMSATLNLEEFTENPRLFSTPPPVFKIEARQFPVTVHFQRNTPQNYFDECLRKIAKIHQKLPDGGILAFVTGQREVEGLVRKLRRRFPYSKDGEGGEAVLSKNKKRLKIPDIKLENYSLPDDNSEPEEDFSEDDEDEEICCTSNPLWVLPLYSLLPLKKQNRIFEKVPENCRLCVISTNVAETSLTIPGIKYVVDSGKTKKKMFDKVTGVASFVVTWTSKASADQRAGRAGRTGPGHCYRLYSSAVFNDQFVGHSEPEILRAPSDDLYLRLRSMKIEKVENFPFPTSPDRLQLKMAKHRLQILEILDDDSQITPLGAAIAKFPILPRFGKMLALSHQHDLINYTICLIAALTVPEILLDGEGKWTNERMRWAGRGNSLLLGDPMVLLRAVGGAEYAHSQGKIEEFCEQHGLRLKAIQEVRKIRVQLSNEVNSNVDGGECFVDPKMVPPDDEKARLLRQIILAGAGDQIARKVHPDEVPTDEKKSSYKYAYRVDSMEDLVYLRKASIFARELPEFLVYQELYQMGDNIDENSKRKIFMRGVTAVEPEWLPVYVKKLCNVSAPLEQPEPWLSEDGEIMCKVTATFGKHSWSLPTISKGFPESEELYRLFSKFFLEGKVLVALAEFERELLSRPSLMVKKWAKLQQRCRVILETLMRNRVTTRDVLLEIMEKNQRFLLQEYLEWLPQSLHSKVISLWPPS